MGEMKKKRLMQPGVMLGMAGGYCIMVAVLLAWFAWRRLTELTEDYNAIPEPVRESIYFFGYRTFVIVLSPLMALSHLFLASWLALTWRQLRRERSGSSVLH
jgi:hypothetical protein